MESNTATETQDRADVVEVSKKILDDLVAETQSKARELQQYALVPKNFEEAERYAKYIRQSQTCPRTKEGPWSEADIFIAIQTCLELGIPIMMGLTGIAIINGRAAIWGDLALALVLRSGLVEDWYERPMKEALAKGEGYFKIKRKDRATPTEVYFSVQDAKTAGLWGKPGPWTNYPGRMLQMRPRGFALRDVFPDVLKGIPIAEEVRDYSLVNQVVEETIRQPKRKSEAMSPTASEPLVVLDGSMVPPADKAEAKPADTKHTAGNGGAQHDAGVSPWRGQIDRVEKKDGTSKDTKTGKDKPYTLYTIHGKDGWKCATFSDTDADVANGCARTGEECEIRWTAGKYGPKAESVQPVGMEAPE